MGALKPTVIEAIRDLRVIISLNLSLIIEIVINPEKGRAAVIKATVAINSSRRILIRIIIINF